LRGLRADSVASRQCCLSLHQHQMQVFSKCAVVGDLRHLSGKTKLGIGIGTGGANEPQNFLGKRRAVA